MAVRIVKEVIIIVIICTDEVCLCGLYSLLAQIHEVGVKVGLSSNSPEPQRLHTWQASQLDVWTK